MLLAGCTSAEPASSEPSKPATPASARATPQVDADPPSPRFAAGRVHAEFPSGWSPAPQAALDKLRMSALAGPGDRSGEVALFVPPSDANAGGFQMFDMLLKDPAPYWGWTLRDVAEAYAAGFRAGPQFESVRIFELRGGLDVVAHGLQASSRVRFWTLPGGSMIQLSCGCEGSACSMFDACRMPDPPGNAVAVAAPIVSAAQPIAMKLDEGPVRADAPPDYQRVASLPESRGSIAKLGYEAPQAAGRAGLVVLDYSRCAQGDEGCTIELVVAQIERVPGATVTRGVTEDVAYRVADFELDGLRRRKVLWEADGQLHMGSCDCSGEACPLMLRTCAAGPAPAPSP